MSLSSLNVFLEIFCMELGETSFMIVNQDEKGGERKMTGSVLIYVLVSLKIITLSMKCSQFDLDFGFNRLMPFMKSLYTLLI